MEPYIASLSRKLKKFENKKAAQEMQQYLRGQFQFFGINSPQRRKLFREYMKSQPLPAYDKLEEIAAELYELPQRDFQYFAIELLAEFKKEWKEEIIVLFEKLIAAKSWWDSVDFIASWLVGPYFTRFPGNKKAITSRWIKSNNIWLQRVAIIFQLGYKEKTDTKILFSYINKLSSHDEFFIKKAIGWALRQYARTDAAAVKQFCENNPLKPLSYREAMKHISND